MLCLSRSPGLLNWRPESPAFCWVLFSLQHLVSNSSALQLTDFLSTPNYIIVQSPTQYLPMTGHRDVSLMPSLEWHVWSSSSENNCHAVHRSLSSSASVCVYRVILPCPILSAKPAYANGICNFRVFGMACLAGSKVNIQYIYVCMYVCMYVWMYVCVYVTQILFESIYQSTGGAIVASSNSNNACTFIFGLMC